MHQKTDTSPNECLCIMLRKEDKGTVDLSLSSHDFQPTNQRPATFCSCAIDPRPYTPLSSHFTRRELHMCSSSQLRSRRSKYVLGKKAGRKPQLIPEPVFVNFSGAWNRFERNQFRKPMKPGGPVQQIGLSYRPKLGIDSWDP
jgi:hypothetical protein